MNDSRQPPCGKRALRSVLRALPRTQFTYNLGKLLTRTLLKPEPHPRLVATRFAGELPLTLDLSSFVANDLYCLDDQYESVTLRLWRQLAREAGTVLDVGSHLGIFSLLAATANPRGRVVAVEADEHNFGLLKANSAGYPNITPVRAAIADRGATMWFCPHPFNDGMGYISPQRSNHPGCYQIQTCSLAELCESQQLGAVDLMKVDVEGFEHSLLVHNEEFWAKWPPRHLIIELTINKAEPQHAREIFAAMERRGYHTRRIQGLYALPWGKPDDLANWHFQRP